MQTVTALFDDRDQAVAAVRALTQHETSSADIAIVSGGAADMPELPFELTPVVLPGIGPGTASGWLIAETAGTVALSGGSLLGGLANAGVPEAKAHVYAEGVGRGGTLLAVRTKDGQVQAVKDILRGAGRIDIEARRTEYMAEGWAGVDETVPAPPADREDS